MLILGTFAFDEMYPTVSFLEHLGWVRETAEGLGDHAYLHTAYFAFFIFIAVFNGFNARTDKLNIFDNLSKNKGFLTVFGIIAGVQIAMTYIGLAVPAVGEILGCHGLNLKEWLLVLAMAISIIPIDLIRKAIVNSVAKD